MKSEKEMAGFIERKVKEFTGDSPLNRMPHSSDEPIFGEPLVQFADGDDPIFGRYKKIIDPSHLTPREAITKAYGKGPQEIGAITVISWVLPITDITGRDSRREKLVPSRRWSHTRWYGEKFNFALRKHMVKLLSGLGYLAVAPLAQPYYREEYANISETGYYSTWSERHMAYACGLGTFSLSDGFITEAGIAHRCGSVVTDLVLPASPRPAGNRYANCLFYTESKCTACVARCPVGAITERGHDKVKCKQYLVDLGYLNEKGEVIKEYHDETTLSGCGLCQTRVPCEFRNPTKDRREKQEVPDSA